MVKKASFICSIFLFGLVFSNSPRQEYNNFLNEKVNLTNNELDKPHQVVGPGGPNQTYLREYIRFGEEYFSMKNYFENLAFYMPTNTEGSCGFVSLIDVLSYYDTFLNDHIIPEQYDFNKTTNQTGIEARETSPGTKKEYYEQSIYQSYYNFCHSTMYDNLESKLTVLNNTITNTDNINNFEASIGGWEYANLLNNFYTNSDISVTVHRSQNLTNSTYLNLIKAEIDNKRPVIVEIRGTSPYSNESLYHSVVAYDYDDENVYASFGWGSSYKHHPLLSESLGYTTISSIYKLDFSNNQHIHSDNYVYDSKGHCGCNLTDEVFFLNGQPKRNVPPTIWWYKDPWVSETYEIYLQLDYDPDYNFFYYTNIQENCITLSETVWAYFLTFYEYTGGGVFYLRRIRSDYQYVVSETVFENVVYDTESFIRGPSTFGLPDSYCYSVVETQHGHYDISFVIRRLRCGYIHNEFINLSPRRNGAGRAVIAFEFEVPIYKIELDISMWSANELTGSYEETAGIYYYDYLDSPQLLFDLFNDISLSTDRTNQDHLYLTFPEPTYCFMITTSGPATGNQNKGRISIGNIKFYGDNFTVYY